MSNTNQNNGNRPAQQQDIQGQIDSAGPTMNSFASGFQSIATAYGDYTKKSFEDTRSFVERLSGAKSLDKVIEIQTDFAKSAFETFVAESQKIGALYRDLAKQSYKPFGGFQAKVTPTNQ
jgi:phasin family protein